jgi:hypothetical protein
MREVLSLCDLESGFELGLGTNLKGFFLGGTAA